MITLVKHLEENGFPVPQIILTKSGEAILETEANGEKKLIVLIRSFFRDIWVTICSVAKKYCLFQIGLRSGIFNCKPQSLRFMEWTA